MRKREITKSIWVHLRYDSQVSALSDKGTEALPVEIQKYWSKNMFSGKMKNLVFPTKPVGTQVEKLSRQLNI